MTADAVDTDLDGTATQSTCHPCREGTGSLLAELHVLQFDIVTIVDIRHIDTHLFVLLRLDTLGECHGLRLHLTVRIECTDRFYPFIRRQDGGKTAVRIILELLDGNTASETTAVGQFPGMVEEIAVTFVVGNTTVVGKRLGIAEWHDFSRIFPRTCR